MYAPCIPGCLFFDIHKSLLLIKKRKKKKEKTRSSCKQASTHTLISKVRLSCTVECLIPLRSVYFDVKHFLENVFLIFTPGQIKIIYG